MPGARVNGLQVSLDSPTNRRRTFKVSNPIHRLRYALRSATGSKTARKRFRKFAKGAVMKRSKARKPPWGMLSFVVNVLRLMLTIIHLPLD